jgi:hypothetical protein
VTFSFFVVKNIHLGLVIELHHLGVSFAKSYFYGVGFLPITLTNPPPFSSGLGTGNGGVRNEHQEASIATSA